MTTCPVCGKEMREIDCGPDGYDDDITYSSDLCESCCLWYDGWFYKYYWDVDGSSQVEGSEGYETIEEAINHRPKEGKLMVKVIRAVWMDIEIKGSDKVCSRCGGKGYIDICVSAGAPVQRTLCPCITPMGGL